MGDIAAETVSDTWSPAGSPDGPAPPDSEPIPRRTPRDYAVTGLLQRSDGLVYHAKQCDLTYEEMVHGVLQGKPYFYKEHTGELPDLEYLVTEIPASYLVFADPLDHGQGDPKSWGAVFRAHVLRLIKNWTNCTALETYLEGNRELQHRLGFDGMPDQSTLWRAWNDRLSGVREAVRTAAEVVVAVARKWDIPAPEPEFRPDDDDSTANKSTKTLARENARDVWKGAKPIVTDCFELHRADNASIPEAAYWEQHAYLGMRTDAHAHDGAENFAEDSTRDLTPCGDSHRLQTADLGVESVRQMLRETSRTLVSRAKSKGKIGREVMASIDITKGYPWRGHIERDDSGTNVDRWKLGYKDGDTRYFQWAVIKVVGHDVPIVLDAVPVHRGYAREDIVDDLLEGATDILPGLDLVLMDREFAHDGVKDTCENHGVAYLNPGKVRSSSDHAYHIARLDNSETDFDVVEQKRLDDGPSRKAIYLPKREWEREDEADEEDSGPTVRQEMLDEFAKIGGDTEPLSQDRDGDSPFGKLLDDMRDEEQESEDVEAPIIPFETNYDLVDVDPEDDREMRHQIGRMMAKYKRRWGIENAFKKLKKFLAATKSPDHRYRYFNFAFACVLYNCWRLVDAD